MVENLVNIKGILNKAKAVLLKSGVMPVDCPKKTCLKLGTIIPTFQDTIIYVDANPPKLPTDEPGRLFESNPICENRCGIGGNSNRSFRIVQELKTAKIKEVKGVWKK